jgi:signal transduction histidine kinase
MSTNPDSFSSLSRSPDVLGELLHSLSQPLTTLRCSLEFSLACEENAHPQQQTVSIALQQTEKVIGMVQLMREYVEAEQPGPDANPAALASVARSVTEEFCSIAAVRRIRLRLTGTCTATLPLPQSRLRLALQYLIASLLEAQPDGGKIVLILGEGPAGSVLRAEGNSHVRAQDFRDREDGALQSARRDAAIANTSLRTARLAIARRIMETAGASLVYGKSPMSGFVLRIPRTP